LQDGGARRLPGLAALVRPIRGGASNFHWEGGVLATAWRRSNCFPFGRGEIFGNKMRSPW
jgi:hypothetical protein